MYEHNALGYRWSLALCLTKVRSSRACCPATAYLICDPNIHCGYSLERVPTMYVLSENIKSKKFSNGFFFFFSFEKKNLYIAWASFGKVVV